MEIIKNQTDRPDTIKVSRSTTGKYSWDIKVTFDRQIDNTGDISDVIKKVDTELKKWYIEGNNQQI